MFNIDKNLESRIDRDRYIGKTFKTNKGYEYKVVGVWEHSPLGRKKRYVIQFLNSDVRAIAYASTIKSGNIRYKSQDKDSAKPNSIKTALLMSDIHFKYEDKDVLSIFYQIAEDLSTEISELIDLGDGINNNALSKFVDIEVNKYTLMEEIIAYKEHIIKLRKLLPSSKFVIIEDNHYHLRKEKFLAENPALIGLIPDIGALFNEIVPHAVPYKPFNQRRFGIIHGINYGKFFTKQNLEMYQMDLICGHTHTMQVYVSASGRDTMPPLRSYGIPCMSIRQRYMQGRPTRQVGGFAVLTYDSDTDNYSVEYVLVEKGKAIFRGKQYSAKTEV